MDPVETLEAPPIAPAEAAVVPPVPLPVETPPEPLSRRDFIEQQVKKADTERGKHAQFQPRDAGKFAGAPQFPNAETQAPTRPAMPKSLKKEVEAHWNAAAPELLNEVSRREQDYEKGIVPLRAKAQEADEILSEFKPYEALIRAENGTPKTAIRNMLQTAAIFRTGTPVQKAQSVAGLIRQFGVPLDQINQLLSGAPAGNGAPAVDAHYQQLAQEFNQLKHTVTQRQEQEEKQRNDQALTAVQKFAETHEHFDAVSSRMYALFQAPQAIGISDTMSETERLQTAYDAAVRLDPALSVQPQAKPSQTAAEVTKSKAAAVQVSGAPASGPITPVDPSDRRAYLANELRKRR